MVRAQLTALLANEGPCRPPRFAPWIRHVGRGSAGAARRCGESVRNLSLTLIIRLVHGRRPRMSFGALLKDVKAQIRETDVETVAKAVAARGGQSGDGTGAGPILIDVREKDEWTEGFIPGARWIPRGFLELRIEDQVPEKSSEIVLYCAGGTRSALAARALGELGYTNVKSMAGGFGAWKRAGLPFERPFEMTKEQTLRYSRHTMLPEVGEAGQVKLLKSKVLCLGAGGLGSPVGL